ncbi:hypothetical protein TNCV_4525251 [Trichonephila clavipes]|nr:hypothetical protein TNCV_4525251 [Trichonephila clavipes]
MNKEREWERERQRDRVRHRGRVSERDRGSEKERKKQGERQKKREKEMDQSSSCHSAERKTPLSPCPSSKTCPDMGLRTASQSRRPKKQRLCNVYAI